MHKYILEIKNVSKGFPGVKALDNASFNVRRGEIHALVGENGAGKSTLMKILNGNYQKDSGEIYFDGQKVEIDSPRVARELGISIVFQELNLVPLLSVAENIFMDRLFKNKFGFVDWAKVYEKTEEILNRINYPLDPRILVGDLSVAQKQMVEIAKALSYENTKLILMDEPSSTLTANECETLFSVVKELRMQGISVIYISHKLEEVFELCDWITILRDGQVIDSKKSYTRDEIIVNMIGREVTDKFPERKALTQEQEILRVEHLTGKGINNVSFTLKKGEVVGFAGLVGAGRTEIARAICGIDFIESGSIYVHGEKVEIKSPKQALNHGIVYLSEDKRNEGLVLTSSVKWNISMANMRKILSNGLLNDKKESKMAEDMIGALNIKTPSPDQYAMNLSGGNQQKIVIGKWLNTNAEIFIFDEPTKGIDVGAKYEIYLLINKLVEEGKSVIFISSEMPEVLGMSDRILVVRNGEITADLTGRDKNAKKVMENAI